MITSQDLLEAGYTKYLSPFLSHIALYNKKYIERFSNEPLYFINIFEYVSGFEAEVWMQRNDMAKTKFKITSITNVSTTIHDIEDLFYNIFVGLNLKTAIDNV